MRRNHRMPVLLAMAITGVLMAAPAQAQSSDSYDSHALKAQAGSGIFPSAVLVQGRQNTVVSKIGGRLSESALRLFAQSDSAKVHAVSYERFVKRSGQWRLAALATLIAGAAAGISLDSEIILYGTGTASLVMGLAGDVAQRNAFNALESAVWWYNRQLVEKR